MYLLKIDLPFKYESMILKTERKKDYQVFAHTMNDLMEELKKNVENMEKSKKLYTYRRTKFMANR